MTELKDSKCLQCGQCCTYGEGKQTKPCRYLERKDNKTYCRIYSNRLGTIIGTIHNKNWYCGHRKDTKNDYLDCPYNTGKPIKTQ